jgi:hypothetical protein
MQSRARKSGQALLFGWWAGGCRDTHEPGTTASGRARCTACYVMHASSSRILHRSLLLSRWTPRMAGRAAVMDARKLAAEGQTALSKCLQVPPSLPLPCWLPARLPTWCPKWPASDEPCSMKRSPGLHDGVGGVNVGLMQPIVIRDP